jgi:hypothetical protein
MSERLEPVVPVNCERGPSGPAVTAESGKA